MSAFLFLDGTSEEVSEAEEKSSSSSRRWMDDRLRVERRLRVELERPKVTVGSCVLGRRRRRVRRQVGQRGQPCFHTYQAPPAAAAMRTHVKPVLRSAVPHEKPGTRVAESSCWRCHSAVACCQLKCGCLNNRLSSADVKL